MQNETSQQRATPDRQAIRAGLESTRAAFHALLDSLSEADWKKQSANPSWAVGTLMWHLGRGMEFFPQAVDWCRKGKGPNPPAFLIGPGNMLQTRFGSRGATPQSAREKYDAGHAKLLLALDSIGDDEWSKSARVYQNDYTIASIFPEVAEHFREHEADILKGLGRL
jgi:hypothetical protein